MKILVVDDSKAKLNEIVRIFCELGENDVELAQCRNEMMKSLKEKTFDLCLLDNNFGIYKDTVQKDMGINIIKSMANPLHQRRFGKTKFALVSSDVITEKFEAPNYIGSVIFGPGLTKEDFEILFKKMMIM